MSSKILFRCDANTQSGYGHLMRCVNLAKHFVLEAANDIHFIGDYDDFAHKLLESNNFKKLDWQKATDSSFLALYDAPDTLLIVDSYAIDNEYIKLLSTYKSRKIYFDDGIAPLNYEEKASAIISLRMDRPLSDFPAGITLYSGLSSFIAAPEMRLLRENNLSKLETTDIQGISKILIFISGKEEGRVLEKKILLALNNLGLKLSVFIISTMDIYSDILLSNIELIRLDPTYEMHRYLTLTSAVISGGGLLKYEAAYCAIPGAIFSLTELQQEDTDSFCQAGLAFDLSHARLSLEERLSIFLKDCSLQIGMMKQSALLFKSNSTQQLTKDLIRL